MTASLQLKTLFRIDGEDYRYYGTTWGRLHFLSVRTNRRLRIHSRSGESIEPDGWDFADLVNTGRAVLVGAPMPQPPRDGSKRRPWVSANLKSDRRRPSKPGSSDAAK